MSCGLGQVAASIKGLHGWRPSDLIMSSVWLCLLISPIPAWTEKTCSDVYGAAERKDDMRLRFEVRTLTRKELSRIFVVSLNDAQSMDNVP